MIILNATALSCLAVLALRTGAVQTVEVKSPNGNVGIAFALKDMAGATSCPVYRVSYKGKTVIAESRLGLDLDTGVLKEGLEIIQHTSRHSDSTWKPVYGERSTIRDHYNQIEVQLQEKEPPHRLLTLTFRAYDEGAALCYTVPEQEVMQRVGDCR